MVDVRWAIEEIEGQAGGITLDRLEQILLAFKWTEDHNGRRSHWWPPDIEQSQWGQPLMLRGEGELATSPECQSVVIALRRWAMWAARRAEM